MDKTAIEAISAQAAAQLAQKEIVDRDIAAVVIPNGYELKSLEPLGNEPTHFRGQFNTTVLSQFIGYIDQNGTAHSGVFIDQEAMSAKAIIDMGNPESPEWGKHKAIATLKRTTAYAALIKYSDERLDQQTFIDFAEDWQDNIAFYFGDNSTADAAQFKEHIKLLRKLKTTAKATSETEVGNFSANRSALESIEITAGSEQPPTGFVFKVIPHDGFEAVAFDCQLRAMPDEKAVKLKYRITQLAQHQETIAEQFRDKIVGGIKVDEIQIFIGNMDYQK